jgi:hypothetical protein
MRKTLEDLYYGNIMPNAQDMAPHSELKRATDRVSRFENQLTELLDETGQTVLTKLIESQHEIDSIIALENFILGFRLGAKLTMECMDRNDGNIRSCIHKRLSKVWKWEILTIASAEEREIS